MDLICFIPASQQLHKMKKSVFDQLPENDLIETYRKAENFFHRLHQPKNLESIIVVCPETLPEFESVILMKDLLFNSKVVLILPCKDAQTVYKGYGLYPRFLTFHDEDFSVVAAVLQKMRLSFYGSHGLSSIHATVKDQSADRAGGPCAETAQTPADNVEPDKTGRNKTPPEPDIE